MRLEIEDGMTVAEIESALSEVPPETKVTVVCATDGNAVMLYFDAAPSEGDRS